MSFVRLDGKMSAKRREDAINRFSVPVAEVDVLQQSCGSRTRGHNVDGDKDDQDFVMEDRDTTDDDDFSDDNSAAWSKKGKGKVKSQKKKGKARAESGTALHGDNPKIMLISLKGKSCGATLIPF
jgi:SWI/SNF-related matrix-associated actin-dependent regulator of chromatin subfamily A3